MNGMRTWEGQLPTFDNVSLFVRSDLPAEAKAVFILVHGLAEHGGRYQYVTEKCNRFGYGVYRFDHRGHGKSEGERAHVDDFMHFVDDAALVVDMAGRENPGLPLFMFGHSMGGQVAAVYGIRYKGVLAGQIFSGALFREPAAAAELKKIDFARLPAAARMPNALAAFVSRDPDVVRAYENDPLVLKEVGLRLLGAIAVRGPAWLNDHVREYDGPCLILHGGGDRIVDPESARWFHAHISSADKELRVYDELYHEVWNEREKDGVIEDIHRWVEKRM